MLRLFLYAILGFILWRMVRVAMRMMQTPRRRDSVDPFAASPHPRKKSDMGDIQDADFEDITDQPSPKSPPPKP